jgi:uncharacterized Zn finger protein
MSRWRLRRYYDEEDDFEDDPDFEEEEEDDDGDRWYYGFRRRPKIQAKGGIKAQSRRGDFGETWWGKRWIAVLESFHIGARLTRGKSYARGGQVLSIDFAEGEIRSAVQGSFRQPYSIRIQLKPLSESDWATLAQLLSTQAIFAAKLLAGEMPAEIEQVFTDAGLALFPRRLGDLKTNCSCPDSSNPCKHIAAVYYLIGEAFDRDPFLLFKLRGKGRDEFTQLLSAQRGSQEGARPEEEAAVVLSPEPLAPDAAQYWQGGSVPDDFFGEVRLPPASAALPRRLGNFPFWRGDEHFLDAMQAIYSQTAPHALDLFVGGTS